MLVSVVMPAYNAEKYIAKAIESVLAQTFRDFEFIIIDDGSTDNSLAIVEKYQVTDARIFIHSHQNEGIGASLNKGMQMAKGEWIARMDADDVMLPNRLEEQVKYLKANPEVDVLSCWAYYINHREQIIGKLIHPTDLNNAQDCKRYLSTNTMVHILHPGVVMRKELILKIGGYKPIASVEDVELWNRAIEHKAIIVCIQQILMKYRIHQDSITTKNYIKSLNYVEWISECMKLRRKGESEISYLTFQQNVKKQSWWNQINRWRKLYSNYSYRNAAFLYGNRKYISSAINLIYSFALDPFKILERVGRQLFVV
jgi:glycosyltransferase involved in cell wall biosynthesis